MIVVVVVVAVVVLTVAVIVITGAVVVLVGVLMLVIVLMHAVPVVVVAVLVILLGGHLVAFKQANAQQQGQAHLALHRVQDPGVGLDLPQAPLHLRQALRAHQVALVEQQDVAIHHLGAGHLAVEDLVAEVLGIDQRDDRVQPGLVA